MFVKYRKEYALDIYLYTMHSSRTKFTFPVPFYSFALTAASFFFSWSLSTLLRILPDADLGMLSMK